MRALVRSLPAQAFGLGLLVVLLIFSPIQGSSRAPGLPVGLEPDISVDLLSNSQFVFGPAARRFDLTDYLARRGSPLLARAGLIENWCAYASVNPRVVLALLELDGQQVTGGWRTPLPVEQQDAAIEKMVLGLAERFYAHLYEYGERAPTWRLTLSKPSIRLQDGTLMTVALSASSATFAVLDSFAGTLAPEELQRGAVEEDASAFLSTWRRLFPESDPLDTSDSITPDAVPPADLLQFPFPVGQTWWFNGAHNWNGSGVTYGKPFSSMDFFTSADSCSAPPAGDWAVAAAPGSGYHPNSRACWYRIDHAGGWSTSYYHLRNTTANGQVDRNASIGTIACETCAGGFASGPHVHFSLLYNGAYVDLEGVKLSGWTVHSGNGDYNTGSLERDGVQRKPYASVFNAGVSSATGTPTASLTTTATPSATLTVTNTPTGTLSPAATTTPSPTAASSTSTPTATATQATPFTARIMSPQINALIRTCPVTLVAEVDVPGGAAEVTFLARYGGSLHEIQVDPDGADGWQAEWDCQDAPDGAAILSVRVQDASGLEAIRDAGLTPVTLSKDCSEGAYRTAFFANAALAASPASSWCKASGVNYNWGASAPGAGVPSADNFSARFRGDFRFTAGGYRFSGQSDDGVRVWVDRALLVDEWYDHGAGNESFEFTRWLDDGLHEIWVDYYERVGSAGVRLVWDEVAVELHRLFLPLLIAETS